MATPDPDLARRPGCDRARVGGDDRVVGEQLAELPGDDLRLQRHVVRGRARLHQLAPVAASPPGLPPGTSGPRCAAAAAGAPERGGCIARQADVNGIAEPDPSRVGVDLDRLRPDRASGSTRCTGMSCRRSAARHSFSSASCRGPGAQQADATGRERAIVGDDILAQERLDDRRRRADPRPPRARLRRQAHRARQGSNGLLPASTAGCAA